MTTNLLPVFRAPNKYDCPVAPESIWKWGHTIFCRVPPLWLYKYN